MRTLFSDYTFSRKRPRTARASAEPPCAQAAGFQGRLAASSQAACPFGLVHSHFWTVSPEVHKVDPEQRQVICRLRTLVTKAGKFLLTYLGNVFFIFNNKGLTKTYFPLPRKQPEL